MRSNQATIRSSEDWISDFQVATLLWNVHVAFLYVHSERENVIVFLDSKLNLQETQFPKRYTQLEFENSINKLGVGRET